MINFKDIIEIIKGKRIITISDNPMYSIRKRQIKAIKKLRKKVKRGEKIKVGFYTWGLHVFQWENVYKMMLKDNRFVPFIVTLINVKNVPPYKANYSLYQNIAQKYPNVYFPYNKETNEIIDYSDCDVAFFCNPYDSMVPPYYKTDHFINKNIPIFYVMYYYSGKTNYDKNVFLSAEFSRFYKVFCENKSMLNMSKQYSICHGKNCILMGYPKMDILPSIQKITKERKKVIIAPHHSILEWKNGVNIGNFLDYYDFFLSLPEKYPNIDWVWRPHQILYEKLCTVWGESKTKEYFDKMNSFPNVEYQVMESYFETFINSDGIIHDCNSFLAEYFYTDKPQCYILKNDDKTNQEFTSFGKELLNHTYKAFNKEQIIDYLNDVVIGGNDKMKKERIKFAKARIRIGYPNASKKIFSYIKKELGIK